MVQNCRRERIQAGNLRKNSGPHDFRRGFCVPLPEAPECEDGDAGLRDEEPKMQKLKRVRSMGRAPCAGRHGYISCEKWYKEHSTLRPFSCFWD